MDSVQSRPQPKVAMVLVIRGMERKVDEHCKSMWETYAFQSKASRIRFPRSWACGACIMLKWWPPITPNFMFSLPHRTSQPFEPKSVRWLRSHFIGACRSKSVQCFWIILGCMCQSLTGSSSSAGGGRGSFGLPATPSLHHTAKVGMGFKVGWGSYADREAIAAEK